MKSDSLVVGIIAEGLTDIVVIRSIIHSLISDIDYEREVIFRLIQPPMTKSFEQEQDSTGTGWSGVYRQIELIRKLGDFQIITNPLLSASQLDVLIVHLDGDVSREKYADGRLPHVKLNNLPCKPISCPLGERQQSKPCIKACSVPQQKSTQLQQVLLDWMGLTTRRQEIVLCTPFDATDAWILAAFFPTHRLVQKKKLECHQKPANILEHEYRVHKTAKYYLNKVECQLKDLWNTVRKTAQKPSGFQRNFSQVLLLSKNRSKLYIESL